MLAHFLLTDGLVGVPCLSWFLVFPLASVSPPPNGVRLALTFSSSGIGGQGGSGEGWGVCAGPTG